MKVRGIRGATTIEANDAGQMQRATLELMERLIEENGLVPGDIAGVFITVTQDLNAMFPASAIRSLPGFELVPLMCSLEIDVPGGLERCIRVMVLYNTEKDQSEIRHVYLNDARRLRPDLQR
jgi:chorismate mutase